MESCEDQVVLIGMEAATRSFAPDEENFGVRIALRAVNEAGGIHGRQLAERSYPRVDRAAAVGNARRLVESDGVFALVNFGGPASLEISKLAARHQVPYLFPHTGLLGAEVERYVFTSFPRYAGEAAVMCRYLAQTRGMKRIGIVHDTNVYGRFFLDRLHEHADRAGYSVCGHCALDTEQPGDLTTQMAVLKEAAPDGLWLALYPAQARAVIEAKGRLAWNEVTLVSVGPLTDEQFLIVPGGHAEGTLGFCYYPDPARGIEPGLAAYREAMARYAPGHPLNRYSLYGWVFTLLMVEGLRRVGRSLTREDFIDAMESIRDWDSGGIMPPVSFSASNHHAQHAGFVCELREGCFQPLTGWISD